MFTKTDSFGLVSTKCMRVFVCVDIYVYVNEKKILCKELLVRYIYLQSVFYIVSLICITGSSRVGVYTQSENECDVIDCYQALLKNFNSVSHLHSLIGNFFNYVNDPNMVVYNSTLG